MPIEIRKALAMLCWSLIPVVGCPTSDNGGDNQEANENQGQDQNANADDTSPSGYWVENGYIDGSPLFIITIDESGQDWAYEFRCACLSVGDPTLGDGGSFEMTGVYTGGPLCDTVPQDASISGTISGSTMTLNLVLSAADGTAQSDNYYELTLLDDLSSVNFAQCI